MTITLSERSTNMMQSKRGLMQRLPLKLRKVGGIYFWRVWRIGGSFYITR